MGYVDQSLTPGESVIARAAVHWWVYVSPAICLIVGWLAIGRSDTLTAVGWGLVFAGLVFALSSWITVKSTELAITSNRVIAKTGLIARKTIELSHAKVESLSVHQSVAGRLFGFGTVTLTGSGGTSAPIANIAAPLEFRRAALQVIERRPLN